MKKKPSPSNKFSINIEKMAAFLKDQTDTIHRMEESLDALSLKQFPISEDDIWEAFNFQALTEAATCDNKWSKNERDELMDSLIVGFGLENILRVAVKRYLEWAKEEQGGSENSVRLVKIANVLKATIKALGLIC